MYNAVKMALTSSKSSQIFHYYKELYVVHPCIFGTPKLLHAIEEKRDVYLLQSTSNLKLNFCIM
jgi:hypothetical protein